MPEPTPILAQTETWLGYAALAAVLALTFFNLRSSHRKMRSGSSPEGFAQDQIAKLRDHGAIKGDMEQLLVELQELSRQINSQIDTKFAKLEASIRAADERIERLERLTRRASGEPAVDTIVDDRPGDEAGHTSPAPSATDPRLEVYALADAGNSAVQIARQTGRTIGEIELILTLLRSH